MSETTLWLPPGTTRLPLSEVINLDSDDADEITISDGVVEDGLDLFGPPLTSEDPTDHRYYYTRLQAEGYLQEFDGETIAVTDADPDYVPEAPLIQGFRGSMLNIAEFLSQFEDGELYEIDIEIKVTPLSTGDDEE